MKCKNCGNKDSFTIIKTTTLEKTDDDTFAEDIIEVIVCNKCKSTIKVSL